jgi:hypothetical protein
MSPDFAGQPLDGTDHALLDQLASIYQRLDPPPADLDERVTFAIGLRDTEFAVALGDLNIEVARLAAQQPIGAARASERTRTTTFDAQSRTIMITIVDRQNGLVRLDGWLAPADALRVELRFPEPAAPQVVTSDETGRFVFDQVPHGLAQLLVYPQEGAEGPRVVTPSLAL